MTHVLQLVARDNLLLVKSQVSLECSGYFFRYVFFDIMHDNRHACIHERVTFIRKGYRLVIYFIYEKDIWYCMFLCCQISCQVLQNVFAENCEHSFRKIPLQLLTATWLLLELASDSLSSSSHSFYNKRYVRIDLPICFNLTHRATLTASIVTHFT